MIKEWLRKIHINSRNLLLSFVPCEVPGCWPSLWKTLPCWLPDGTLCLHIMDDRLLLHVVHPRSFLRPNPAVRSQFFLAVKNNSRWYLLFLITRSKYSIFATFNSLEQFSVGTWSFQYLRSMLCWALQSNKEIYSINNQPIYELINLLSIGCNNSVNMLQEFYL